MSQFEVGDIVVYDPPDPTAMDCNSHYVNSVGVVTDDPIPDQQTERSVYETHVNWISCPFRDAQPNPCRHYTKNLRKLGHITPPGP